MIQWLVQPADQYPDLARGSPPPGVFSPAELRRQAHFRFEKRRREWLLGRWTAKQLLRSYLRDQNLPDVPLNALVIARESGGAPVAVLAEPLALAAGWQPGDVEELPLIAEAGERPDGPPLAVRGIRLPVSLSISHSNGVAFCALLADDGTAPARQLGADIERIETRSEQFCATFLIAAEMDRIASAPVGEVDALVTAVWSAKESVLKALQLGLTVDMRRVTVLCRPPTDPSAWMPIGVSCDPTLQPRPNLAFGVTSTVQHRLTAWWRVEDGYVLTLAVLEAAPDASARE